MLISILGVLIGIAIPSLWIFLPLKKLPKEKQLSKSVHIRSILLGATLCTLCIFIPEAIWDKVTGMPTEAVTHVWEAFVTAFLRAGLIEEGIKLLFVRRVLKKHKPGGKLACMLLAATIGMGYGIIEKLVLSPGAVVFSAFFSFHIMFQFIMGAYLYEAQQSEDAAEKRRLSILAFLLPFLVHGAWDTLLFIGEMWMNDESGILMIVGLVLLLALIAGGILFEVKTIQYLRKQLVREKNPYGNEVCTGMT